MALITEIDSCFTNS